MFPFRLGTTSYIYPDSILPNVAKLVPFLDEIELVLFESEGQDNYPGEVELRKLMDFCLNGEVAFNVHLPIDIFLGDKNEEVRLRGISVVKKVIEQTLCLHPSVFILHFDLRDKNGQEAQDVETWRNRILQSSKEILESGIEPNRVSIETLGYPFGWVEDIVRQCGFSICLDIGHILLYGQDLKFYLNQYLPEASIVHLHGFRDGIDHLGIDRLPDPTLKLIFSHLLNYHGIVSIEVFSMDDLKRSLFTLEEKWRVE